MTLMCPVCARTPEGCASDGCGPAGLTAPEPVDVPDDARARAAASFVARRSVLPKGKPAWGTAADAAHMTQTCDPATCPRCALVEQMRSLGGDGP